MKKELKKELKKYLKKELKKELKKYLKKELKKELKKYLKKFFVCLLMAVMSVSLLSVIDFSLVDRSVEICDLLTGVTMVKAGEGLEKEFLATILFDNAGYIKMINSQAECGSGNVVRRNSLKHQIYNCYIVKWPNVQVEYKIIFNAIGNQNVVNLDNIIRTRGRGS